MKNRDHREVIARIESYSAQVDSIWQHVLAEFEDYISIFRAAGISVTLLLQSESQLSSMYGPEAAKTIINNCDTYVYMGGMDIETCRSIAAKSNKTLATIMSLPKKSVVVFRRGEKPWFSERYRITEDPEYIKAMELYEEQAGYEVTDGFMN